MSTNGLDAGSSPQVRGRLHSEVAHAAADGLIPAGAGQTAWGHPWRDFGGAHPRRCGADPGILRTTHTARGSSPQVRGRRRSGIPPVRLVGLIPAGAGQTLPSQYRRYAVRAHPRRCGADKYRHQGRSDGAGSSPQVRGRPAPGGAARRRAGLIPAGAGQTEQRRGHFRTNWAHPRRCGADSCPPPLHQPGPGSSPQVRGRLGCADGSGHLRGLIPAGAGQTVGQSPEPPARRAHPRRCGADVKQVQAQADMAGSSPQVRGRRRHPLNLRTTGGLIPAGAGQTCFGQFLPVHLRAHPRRCGADCSAVPPESLRGGSSPQVRGRLVLETRRRRGPGLIPAGAGQTQCHALEQSNPRAHPRRCGADDYGLAPNDAYAGSSPQVRGRPVRDVMGAVRRGLIPAGAGQTSVLQVSP